MDLSRLRYAPTASGCISSEPARRPLKSYREYRYSRNTPKENLEWAPCKGGPPDVA